MRLDGKPVPDCRALALALRLAPLGAPGVIVGGTARMLTMVTTRTPLDLDLVVPKAATPHLVTALRCLGARGPSTAATLRAGQARLNTSWGPVDVFIATEPDQQRMIEYAGCHLIVEVLT